MSIRANPEWLFSNGPILEAFHHIAVFIPKKHFIYIRYILGFVVVVVLFIKLH